MKQPRITNIRKREKIVNENIAPSWDYITSYHVIDHKLQHTSSPNP